MNRLGTAGQSLLLFLITLAAYAPGLGRQEFIGTEDFRARIAEEMLHSGDWVHPTFYGRPILTKPPLHYLALGAAMSLSGERSPWSTRWVGLLALAVTVAAIGSAARGSAGPRAGWVAGLGYLVGLYVLKNGVNAEIDPLFAALTVLAVLGWWKALEPGAPHRISVSAGLLAGACVGLAAMAKGPAVLPFAIGALVAAPWSGRPLRRAAWLAALPPLLALSLAWPLALWLRADGAADPVTQGANLWFGWTERTLRRTLTYPLALFGAALPFTLPSLFRLRAPERAPLDRYAMLTVAIAFVILLLPAEKSTRYLLPCFPLLTLAGALRLELFGWTTTFIRGVGAAFAVAAVVGSLAAGYELDAAGWASVAAVAAAGAAAALWAPRRPVLTLVALAITLRLLVVQVYVPGWEASGRSVKPVVAELRAHLREGQRLAVVALQTPRLTDPLAEEITYFHGGAELRAALAAGDRYDAVLLAWLRPGDDPPGHRLVASVAGLGKDLRIYAPED